VIVLGEAPHTEKSARVPRGGAEGQPSGYVLPRPNRDGHRSIRTIR
jgi:hypothetical protein